MSASLGLTQFDPYHRWLSIPPEEQPPHHYRLLSLKLFEEDADVIESAADRQMAHVRSFQGGQHADDSQRLLNEISAARVVLLDAAKKTAYDAQLRAKIDSAEKKRKQDRPLPVAQPLEPWGRSPDLPAGEAGAGTVDTDRRPLPSLAAAHRRRGTQSLVPMLIAGGVVLALLAVAGGAAVVFWPPPEQVADRGDKPANPAPNNALQVTADSQPSAPYPAPSTSATPPPPPPVGVNESPEDQVAVADIPPDDVVVDDGPPDAAPSGDLRPPLAVVAEGPKKLPVPDKEARDAKRAQIAAIFPVDKAGTPEEKAALAGQLFQTARDTRDDPAAQFALLNLAREQAVQAGQIKTAFAAVDLLAKTFDFDADAIRVVSLQEAAKAPIPPADKRDIVTLGMGMIDGFVAADEFDKAAALSERLVSIARPIRDAELLKAIAEQRRAADALAADYRKAKAAFETLKTAPDDPDANLAAGRYLVFAKQDWNTGLAHLAKSSDALLSAAAKLELAAPTEAADQEKLADAWWAAADAEKEKPYQDLCRERSGMWYLQVVSKLSGLNKAKAEKRISEAQLDAVHPVLGYALRPHPPDAEHLNGRWYMYIKGSPTWQEAYQHCRDMGGHLMCVETSDEAQLLKRFHHCWLGGIKRDGKWAWINGAEFTFTSWRRGQPNEANRDLVCIYTDPHGNWVASEGVEKSAQVYGFVCEWPE